MPRAPGTGRARADRTTCLGIVRMISDGNIAALIPVLHARVQLRVQQQGMALVGAGTPLRWRPSAHGYCGGSKALLVVNGATVPALLGLTRCNDA